MAKGRGYLEVTGPDGRKVVRETFTCCHCDGIHLVPLTGAGEIAFCRYCDRRECVPCAKRLNGRCANIERQLDQYERRMKLLAAITG